MKKRKREIPQMEKDRLSICAECPFLWKGKVCKKCGCVMPLKVKITKASCPIGKW